MICHVQLPVNLVNAFYCFSALAIPPIRILPHVPSKIQALSPNVKAETSPAKSGAGARKVAKAHRKLLT